MLRAVIERSVKTDWLPVLLNYLTDEMSTLLEQVEAKVFPPQDLIFNAFNHFDVKGTKVVILGLDPYIREGQAMGMSFSVPEGCKVPPSLKNIYKEIQTDMGTDTTGRSGDLTHWADQGVLLLNCYLTVEEGKTKSHKKIWKKYTDQLITFISTELDNLVFIFWGNDAKEKIKLIDTGKHHILKGVHPSPLSASRGFFGCKHFSKCNQIIEKHGGTPIEW